MKSTFNYTTRPNIIFLFRLFETAMQKANAQKLQHSATTQSFISPLLNFPSTWKFCRAFLSVFILVQIFV